MTPPIWQHDLARYSLQLAILVVAAALLARLFRFRASVLTLAYWHLLLAACLALPVLQPWKATPMRPAVTAGLEAGSAVILPGDAAGAAPAPQPISWPVSELVLMILAVGVAARGLWLAAGLWSLQRLRRESCALPDPLGAEFACVMRRLGARAEFRTSSGTATPITFGLRRPTILLPAKISELEPETREAIACHELLHVGRRDWAWCVAEELARTLLWFHPAVWWLIDRIRLTREQVVDQVVIGLTGSREQYVQALLSVACARSERQFVPATLFLRKGLLKRRVAEILKEKTMTQRRLILSLVTSVFAIFLAAGATVKLLPLEARAQDRNSASGPIQVLEGGEALVHRAPIVYPSGALEKSVQGDVLLDVALDERGQVADARVLSGPEELRRACLQSVLEWRWGSPTPMPGSVQVTIRFQMPAEGTSKEVVLPGFPEETFVYVGDRRQLENEIREIGAALEDPGTPSEKKALLKQQLEERELKLAHARESGQGKWVSMAVNDQPIEGKLVSISSERVAPAVQEQLMSRINLHLGDAINEKVAQEVREAVAHFDPKLHARFHSTEQGGVNLVIVGP